MPHTSQLALCFKNPQRLPSDDLDASSLWLELVPAGTFTGDDGRTWHNTEADHVIARSNLKNIPFDIEHATHLKAPQGEPAPAHGWAEELQNRNGAVWARFALNSLGKRVITNREYRYYSPAFNYDNNGNVLSVRSVAFTNEPNLNFPALNRAEPNPKNQKENDMPIPASIIGALGLKADSATETDVVNAIGALKTDKDLALNRAQTAENKQPDLSLFVPKETHQLALNRAEQAETKLADIANAEIEALVDGAVKAGKIAPANKEMYLATCRAEGGREKFEAFLQSAPVIAANDSSVKGKSADTDKATALTDGELAMCRSLGLTAEQFLASKKQQETN